VGNVSLHLIGTTIVSEYGALADIPKKDLDAQLDTPGGPEVMGRAARGAVAKGFISVG